MTNFHTQPASKGTPFASDPAALLATAFAPLREAVSQWVAEELHKWQAAQQGQAKDNEMLTRKALKAEFDICTQTVRNWERERILNPLTVGRRVFYLRSEVVDALKGRTKADGTRLYARQAKSKTR